MLLFLKGQPVAFIRYSDERASAVPAPMGFEYFQWVPCIHLPTLSVHNFKRGTTVSVFTVRGCFEVNISRRLLKADMG